MRVKIVLLYENEQGKILCDVASRVLTAISLSFGHSFVLSARYSRALEVEDAVLDACLEADAVLAGSAQMVSLPSLTMEMECLSRVRELRYDHFVANRSLMGEGKPLRAVVVQALEADMDALKSAVQTAYTVAEREELTIHAVPPSGKLLQDWQDALKEAQGKKLKHDWSLPETLPAVIRDPAYAGVILCPPYAGMVVAPAVTALCGAPAMGYDQYVGGKCPLYAPLAMEESTHGDEVNPFGMLRAVHGLLRDSLNMELEAGCVEAALRNVLQAGWRSVDIAETGLPQLGADGIADLLCQQIEVAGEWVSNQ